jgi:hypothetical protein
MPGTGSDARARIACISLKLAPRLEYVPQASSQKQKHKEARSFLKKRTKRLLSFDAIPNISVMASTFLQAQEQESFGSFLQKRTFFFNNKLI